MKILKEKDLYKKILDRIEEKRIEDLSKPEEERTFWSLPKNYLIFQELGFCSALTYEIEKFVNDLPLRNNKTRPLHKNKLYELCKLLDIELLHTYYGVKM